MNEQAAAPVDAHIFETMAQEIIAEQAKIIGPLAYRQAENVPGLSVDRAAGTVTVQGDGPQVIDLLVRQYEEFFGKAAVEVCKEAVGNIAFSLSPDLLPATLR